MWQKFGWSVPLSYSRALILMSMKEGGQEVLRVTTRFRQFEIIFFLLTDRWL